MFKTLVSVCYIFLLLHSGALLAESQDLPLECKQFDTPLGLDIAKTSSLLRNSNWKERSRGVRCLSLLKDSAKLLSQVANDPDPRVKRTALYSLGERLIPSDIYLILLGDKAPLVRSVAARYAYLSGPAAVPHLARIAANSANPVEQRVFALRSISKLSTQARAAGKTLATLSSDKDPSVRLAAIKALGSLGTSAQEYIGSLDKQLKKSPKGSLEAKWLRESIVRLDPNRLGTH